MLLSFVLVEVNNKFHIIFMDDYVKLQMQYVDIYCGVKNAWIMLGKFGNIITIFRSSLHLVACFTFGKGCH